MAQDFLTGRNIPMMNENAIANMLVDINFLEEEFKKNGRPQLMTAFAELRAVGYFGLNRIVAAVTKSTSSRR